jgi:hypothetical protein
MKSEAMQDAVLELLWSAWTELGVPGVNRRYQRVALDPEPLIIFTPGLASHDPRLVEQVRAWCERHGAVISKTRLDGLSSRAPEIVRSAFTTFAESLGGAAVSWRGSKLGRGVPARVEGSGLPPLDRPAVARLRMRSLAGTGARADVLCELLGTADRWTTATDLEHLGYTRRYISSVLSDLTAARLTTEKLGKGAASFRFRDPRALATLIDAADLIWPDWTAVLMLASQLIELERSAVRSTVLAPVKARDAWNDLRRLSLASGMHEPPKPTGEAASSAILRWGSTVLRRWPSELSP